MASRIRRLFFGDKNKSPSTRGNPKLQGASYDSAVALDPPLKGSYPVAGNGPNVLDEIQRSRPKKDAARQQQSIRSGAVGPRQPEDPIERPRTAPGNVTRGKGLRSGADNDGRTRSGFSTKSPPTFFSSGRRNSMRSIFETSPPPLPSQISVHTQISRTSTPSTEEVKTYQPRKAPDLPEPATVPPFKPPFAQHERGGSTTSHRTYVDLLEAHSNIDASQDASKHRQKASGVRNYGEDVADRNIAKNEAHLDLNSPELSYLKVLYRPKQSGVAVPREGVHHPRSTSADYDLGSGQLTGDDINNIPRIQTKANSTRFTQNNSSRTGFAFPPRTDSATAQTLYTNRGRDDLRSATSNGVQDHRSRALSPYSTSASICEEPEEFEPAFTFPKTSTPPVPPRGRGRPATSDGHNPPPVSLSSRSRFNDPPSQRTSSGQDPPLKPSLKHRRRTISETSQASVTSSRASSRNGSVSFSFFPNVSGQHSPPKHEPYSRNRDPGMAEGSREPPNLKGVVDLTNTVDTDVTTRTAKGTETAPISPVSSSSQQPNVSSRRMYPSHGSQQTLNTVTHEHVTPVRKEIREERVTREIHEHDVFHRVLPVIETEILPPKHYVPSQDGRGLVEIPEHMVPGRTLNGSPRNWEIKVVPAGPGRVDNSSPLHRKTSPVRRRPSQTDTYTHPIINEEESAEPPVVAFTRPEQKANQKASRSRANSNASTIIPHSRTNSLASTIGNMKSKSKPVLTDKQERITKEGYPRTEYTWHHAPTFQTSSSQPRYVGAGKGDLSSPGTYYSDEDDADASGADFGAMKGEGGLLFRDSGYGHGALPGLVDSAPLAGRAFVPEDFEVIRLGKVVGGEGSRSKGEGEATKALRKIRERRRSSGSNASTVQSVDGLERGVNGLKI